MERVAGETKWSFWKLFRYSLEGLFAFSTAPLALASLTGIGFVALSLAMMLALIIREWIYHVSTPGWTSLVCALLLISGVQLFCLGVFGQYLAKVYMEVKQRPHFIIGKSSDDDKRTTPRQIPAPRL